MSDTLMDTIKAWDGKESVDCFNCFQSIDHYTYKPFCSEQCLDSFDERMPTEYIHALYDKLAKIKEE